MNTATFAFSANETGATFECSLDEAAFSACSSPMKYGSLAEGPHSFRVRAGDAVGNWEATVALHAWTVDLTAETSITATPPNPTNQTTATFAFSANEIGATFECSLDEVAFSPCPSPVAFLPLSAGTHTFRVRARDGLGNVDSTPALHSWVIDLEAPETLIESVPINSNQARATFIFSSSESGSRFDCSLDEEPFSSCSSPQLYPPLEDGSHSFRVRARDAAGNLDTTPASFRWNIRADREPPDTSFALQPPAETNERVPGFRYSSSELPYTAECSLDGAPFTPCPEVFPALDDGPHWLEARACDGVGNCDPIPARSEWYVDTEKPEAPILLEPKPQQTFLTATPRFSGTAEANTLVTLFIDGLEAGEVRVNAQGAWEADQEFWENSPVFRDAPLAWGEHSVSVQARDKAGNTGSRFPEVLFFTSRGGYYGMGCTASAPAWQTSWGWALVLLILLRGRSRAH
ncbi:MAG TPA: Ig-like domain-containing protein [Myxococcaceae bacterium]